MQFPCQAFWSSGSYNPLPIFHDSSLRLSYSSCIVDISVEVRNPMTFILSFSLITFVTTARHYIKGSSFFSHPNKQISTISL